MAESESEPPDWLSFWMDVRLANPKASTHKGARPNTIKARLQKRHLLLSELAT